MTEDMLRDARDVRAWRGLKPNIMAELDQLDRDAIALRDRFSDLRKDHLRSRARCLELREKHGLTIFQKL